MNFELAFEFLKSKGCKILPERGNLKFDLNKDKNGYNLIIVPDNPKYSIVIIGFDEDKVADLRDRLNELLTRD